ncbi:MAG: hypothetical protein GY777_03090 [Candidatus Brocadiaceae bacterium]|nr:hypothetical protein [Candidatus Brocadiaceae bacterium]
MKTIVVSGTASGVGKTTIASYMLNNLTGLGKKKEELVGTDHRRILQNVCSDTIEPLKYSYSSCNPGSPWSALKITIRHEGSCPRHTECDTCDDGYEPFKVLTEDDVIRQEGKDTDRMVSAGASKVVWLQSDSNVEKAGIDAALACFDKTHNLLVEGNSFLRVRSADVAVLVVSPFIDKIKRSAKLLIDKIDIVVINVNNHHTDTEIKECQRKMIDLGFDVLFYIVNPFSNENYSSQPFLDKLQSILF